MSLSAAAAIAVLSFTSPDICSQAYDLAHSIQSARNAGVPAIEVLMILDGSEIYQELTIVSYANDPMPPAIFAGIVEGSCRKAVR